jgi:hypothetical protein
MPKPEPFELTDADKYLYVDSASDQRTVNNVMRHQYRVLTDSEKERMMRVKDMGRLFIEFVELSVPNGRMASIAKTKMEEAVMWAVKGLTD